ncbi:MAG: hypothetical protein ACQERZ_09975, partial [Fusobacteriota bacterium]
DMGGEPHIYIFPKYRRKGHGSRLLKKYLIVNHLVGDNRYVFYKAYSDMGKSLVESFSSKHRNFHVIKVEKSKYIIIRDSRF